MVYCPFCAHQGVIYKAKVSKLDIQIFICDECDTIWYSENISEDNCINYKIFLKEHNLGDLWSNLVEVERI